jgi:hypothetical protein
MTPQLPPLLERIARIIPRANSSSAGGVVHLLLQRRGPDMDLVVPLTAPALQTTVNA